MPVLTHGGPCICMQATLPACNNARLVYATPNFPALGARRVRWRWDGTSRMQQLAARILHAELPGAANTESLLALAGHGLYDSVSYTQRCRSATALYSFKLATRARPLTEQQRQHKFFQIIPFGSKQTCAFE